MMYTFNWLCYGLLLLIDASTNSSVILSSSLDDFYCVWCQKLILILIHHLKLPVQRSALKITKMFIHSPASEC